MLKPVAAAAALLLLLAQPGWCRVIRVCADPKNMPFSDTAEEGFENEIVDLLAKDLHADIKYVWFAQQRGFIRNTLGADLCDLVPGVPVSLPGVAATHPYYRSVYVFVAKPRLADLASLDDPRLQKMKIGVQLIGDRGFNTPPAQALGRRALTGSIEGFPVADRESALASAGIVNAVEKDEVDVSIVWGPIAGYYAAREPVRLHVRAVSPLLDGPRNPMVFDVAMGVQTDEDDLRRDLNAAIERHRAQIRAILDRFDVPQL